MDEYTPEKVAELARRLRGDILDAVPDDGDLQSVLDLAAAADALTAVSANRDELRSIISEQEKANRRLQSERDRLHKAITEALAFESVLPAIATEPRRILRAALDKGRNDDE